MNDISIKSIKKAHIIESETTNTKNLFTEKKKEKSDRSSFDSLNFSPLIIPKKTVFKPSLDLPPNESKLHISLLSKNEDQKVTDLRTLYKRKKYEDVKKECTALLKKNKPDPNLLYLLANSCMFLDQSEKAIKVSLKEI